jgi:glycosyltransferase involved in cell wall biosynthesis
MKIGIDIRAIGKKRTGDETYTLELVKSLAKIDKENSYLLYTDTNVDSEMAEIGQKLAIPNKNFSLVPVLPASKLLWTFRLLPRQAKKDKVDVLHVQHISPLTLSGKIKLVTTVHDLSFERYPQHIKFWDRFFLKLLIPASVEYADKVIAVSEFTKREIVELYKTDPEKIVAINNGGADEKFLQPVSGELRNELRKFLGFENPYILYVGTLQPRKNIPVLLENYARLIQDNQHDLAVQRNDLVIVGSKTGPNYDQKIDKTLKLLIAKNPELKNKIHFPGYIKDELLPGLYQESTMFCFPTLYEGFGLPMIEAMTSGTPVVCSSSSCLLEIGGGAALFFDDQKSKSSMSRGMREIIVNQQLASSMRKKGLEVARKFSWNKCATETLALYGKVTYSGRDI